MLQQKILTALCSLALASSMAVPAFAAGTIPPRQTSCEWETIRSEQTSITEDNLPAVEEEKILTRAELISVLYQKEGEPAVNFAMDYTDVDLMLRMQKPFAGHPARELWAVTAMGPSARTMPSHGNRWP